jgi:3-isopropylmalate/(R)-2-methylmalate dehydratase small subunit
MRRFETLRSVAASLPDADIDTDVIFPARFLLLLDKAGLGKHLFNERRHDRSGALRPDFVLNQAPFDEARILIAGPRFGSGSSREQAVWALADFGIACVIAPSFGEIFYANCFKNGVLAIRAEPAIHGAMLQAAEAGESFTVDLERQSVSWTAGSLSFEIDDYRRKALLEGLDEIALTLAEDCDAIAAFEARWSARAPWVAIEESARMMAPAGIKAIR